MKLFTVLLLSIVAPTFAADISSAKEIVKNMNKYIANYDEHQMLKLFHTSFVFEDCMGKFDQTSYAKFLLLENSTYTEPNRFEELKTGFIFGTQGNDGNSVLYQTLLARKDTYEIIYGRLANKNCPLN